MNCFAVTERSRWLIFLKPTTYLPRYILNNMQRVMDPQLLDGGTMKEIFEIRLVIEMGLADILFLRKTESGLIKLEQIVEQE